MATDIPYCDESWNVFIGCPPPLIGAGCTHCWARDLHTMRHKAYLAGKNMPQQYAKSFDELQFISSRLEQPYQWAKARRIFVLPQSDLFHSHVTNEQINTVFKIIKDTPRHTYLIFTKRWDRMAGYAVTRAIPSNVWWIASASTQYELNEARHWLTPIQGRIAVSLEPLLENVHLTPSWEWVIVGCESGGHRSRCDLEWVRRIVQDCDAANIPLYVKQLDLHGKRVTNPDKFPKDLQRREIP